MRSFSISSMSPLLSALSGRGFVRVQASRIAFFAISGIVLDAVRNIQLVVHAAEQFDKLCNLILL